jgi:hyperosmotically inducible periplasmic protein
VNLRHVVVAYATVAAALAAPLALAQTAPSSGDVSSPSSSASTSKKQMRADNRMLSKAVRRALTKTKGLDSSAITVLSHNGKVTLEGTVLEDSQIKLAGDAASATRGVVQVDNRIIVRLAGN